jgi:hypothetical protein
MPRIETEVPHRLDVAEARQRLQDLYEIVLTEYAHMVSDLQGTWDADTLRVSFKAYGFVIASHVRVEPERVAVTGDIPLAAIPFRGKIQQTILGKLEEVLS